MGTTRLRRVAVIGGGQSSEHPSWLASATSVARALDPGHHVVVRLTIAPDGVWHLDSDPLGHTPAQSLAAAVRHLAGCDVVFPAIQGPRAEDGTLAALCRLVGVPLVGTARSLDRITTKGVAASLGIETVPGVIVTSATVDSVRWDGPVVVRPTTAGSGHGVALVRSPDELSPILHSALLLDGRILVEEAMTGREVNVAVLERSDGDHLVGPALEIVSPEDTPPESPTADTGPTAFGRPARLEDVERKELADAALALFEALGCAGVARFDFVLTPTGLVLDDVNTMPGMTQRSQVPRIFAAAGMTYPALLTHLVRDAA